MFIVFTRKKIVWTSFVFMESNLTYNPSAETLMVIVRSSACTGESELVLGFYVLHHYEDGFVVM
jgi:hypothetical protein